MTVVNMPTLCSVKSDVSVSQMMNKALEMVYKYKKDHPVTQLENTTHKLGPQTKLDSIDVLHTAKLFKYLLTHV